MATNRVAMDTSPVATAMLASVVVAMIGVGLVASLVPEPASLYVAKPYVALAVPSFFALILIEVCLQRVYGVSTTGKYDMKDTYGAMAAGASQRIAIKLFLGPVCKIGPYLAVYQYASRQGFHHLLDPTTTDTHASYSTATVVAIHILFALSVDFCYYWLHRANHTTFLWVGHSIHHDSDRYNLSTALRQGILQAATAFVYYMPLAFFIPPKWFMVHNGLNVVYQFWVHTTLIRRMGPFEYVFMTPSHHRVHHDRRVHKNFGGVLIVWDKLFGSFLDEDAPLYKKRGDASVDTTTLPSVITRNGQPTREEKCWFGQRHPMKDVVSGVHQLDEPIAHLNAALAVWGRRGAWASLGALLRGPGWTTAGLRQRKALPDQCSGQTARVRLPPTTVGAGTLAYVMINGLGASTLVLALLVSQDDAASLVPLAATIWSALMCLAWLVDGKPWAWATEGARVSCTLAYWGWVAPPSFLAYIICGVTISTLSLPVLNVFVTSKRARSS
eukprot:m.31203 g.31203  ORF g.31203 m.31203 type:complete len:500 (-) comp4782_c0_seq1:67-1566(-)